MSCLIFRKMPIICSPSSGRSGRRRKARPSIAATSFSSCQRWASVQARWLSHLPQMRSRTSSWLPIGAATRYPRSATSSRRSSSNVIRAAVSHSTRTGPTPGKIKAMVESSNVAWDVADRNLLSALELGRQGLLEKVDESIVDLNAVPSQFRTEWGVGSYFFSFVITYDSARFGATPPQTWKDFWDTQNFKGKRALRNNVEGVLESALLADGVERHKLYPLDVDRGLEKVRAIKKDTIFYSNTSEAQQLLRSGEVSVGSLWNTRAQGVKEDTKGRVNYHFNEGILLIAAWNVLKGTKNAKDAWRWVALSQDPTLQVALLTRLGWGPINPAANKLIPAELQQQNPGSPENLARQVAVEAEWYARHYFEVQNRYLDVLAS
ncbi:extracellular solute-binding protein [Bradyrhizobium sp. USDA 4350]